ncbi:hypothetical protein HY734_01315 [Candidatus Uhrbacteria bacterium]|nr:hypothetical protein [Candidatus Uhrbacteria bacterium]
MGGNRQGEKTWRFIGLQAAAQLQALLNQLINADEHWNQDNDPSDIIGVACSLLVRDDHNPLSMIVSAPQPWRGCGLRLESAITRILRELQSVAE